MGMDGLAMKKLLTTTGAIMKKIAKHSIRGGK